MSKNKFELMFSHPGVSVTWRADKRCLYFQGQAARGVTQVLQACFYPHYRYRDAQKHNTRAPRSKTIVRAKRGSALAQGKWLDRDVGALCTHLHKSATANLDLLLKTPEDRFWRQRHPGLRPLCVWMQQHGWTPKKTQLCVGNPTLRLATRVDLVAEHKNGTLGIFELKYGFDDYYEESTGKNMLAPLYFCSDAPRWQHQLQLLLTKTLFQHTFPNLPLHDVGGYVIRVGRDRSVEAFPLVRWNQHTLTLIDEKLKSTAHETRIQRKSRIRCARYKRKRKPTSE